MIKTDEVVEKMRKLIPISNPKNQTELDNPNYAIYALAPFAYNGIHFSRKDYHQCLEIKKSN